MRTTKEKASASDERLLGDEVYAMLAETFGALADSNRAKIIYLLVDQEMCVGEIARVVHISESAVSQHLRILRALRLVRPRKEGRNIYYTLDDDHIRQLLNVCLEHVEHS